MDLTPAEPGSHTATVQVRLLLESELGEKEETQLDYVSHTHALALLQEKDKVRRKAYNIHHDAYNIHHDAYNIHPDAYNIPPDVRFQVRLRE